MDLKTHAIITTTTTLAFAGAAYLVGPLKPAEAAVTGFMYSLGCKVVRCTAGLAINNKNAGAAPAFVMLARIITGVALVALGIGSLYIAADYTGTAITFKAVAIEYGTGFALSVVLHKALGAINPGLFKKI